MQIDLSVRANNRNLFSLSAKKYNDRLKFSGSDASMSSSAQRFILNFQSIEVGRPWKRIAKDLKSWDLDLNTQSLKDYKTKCMKNSQENIDAELKSLW